MITPAKVSPGCDYVGTYGIHTVGWGLLGDIEAGKIPGYSPTPAFTWEERPLPITCPL